MSAKDNQLRVVSFEPNLVQIEIVDFNKWKQEDTSSEIKLGSVLKIDDGDNNNIMCLVKSFKMVDDTDTHETVSSEESYRGKFILNTQPIGKIENSKFKRGINDISIPPNGISVASSQELKLIYQVQGNATLDFASHRLDENIDIISDGNKLFSKHLAVVGSTGSGKSCTVAKVIQELEKKPDELGQRNNTHVLIFDIHGEYKEAFPNSNYLSIENKSLLIPYWLMNSEELEDLFIESGDSNSYNQVSQFKFAVTQNKKRHNPDRDDITYDSPVYFDIKEVYNYIRNKNYQTHYVENGNEYLAIQGEKPILASDFDNHFWNELPFEKANASKSTVFKEKITKGGGFTGEFERFLSRIETKLADDRLQFILDTTNESDENPKELLCYLKKLIGYEYTKENNITIIDLSSIPFEIVSIVVSITSRLLFDFSYLKTKLLKENDTPFMVVYEEAHKYIPKNNESRFRNTRIAVERIAKEGRKYGLSAMIVSQRPSELSSTVFSQCTNFIIMRLTNPDDQSYVKRLLPEASIGFGDELSSLEQREALLVGDAFTTPIVAKIKEANPTPKSEDINFYSLWQEEWKDVEFDELF